MRFYAEHEKPEVPGTFKVLVRDSSKTYATNMVRFDNADEALEYGHDLAMRWTALRNFAVVRADLMPNVEGYYSRELVEKEVIGKIVDY